jgi:hypothetical protein
MATSKRTTRRTSGTQSENGAGPPADPAASAAAPKAPTAKAPAAKTPAAKTPATKAPAAKTHSRKPKAAAVGHSRSDEDRQASIARAAYLRSLSRGFQPGFELEDWLAAEAEVDQRLIGEGHAPGGSSSER